MKVSSTEIGEFIREKITACFQGDGGYIDLISGDIQKELNIKDSTPQVCAGMLKAAEQYPHQIIERPFKWMGTRLKIRYYRDASSKAADEIIVTIIREPKGSVSAENNPKQTKVRVDEKNPKVKLPSPSVKEVQFYLKSWEGLNNYVRQEEALSKLFHVTYPKNSLIDEVLVKVCALNAFYSTNIFDIFKVAEHIVQLDIDNALQSGDQNLVEKIARIDDKSNNNYSFATKYCSHHFADKYAIYDSFVHKVLVCFRKADGFYAFSDSDLKNYPTFHKIILEFRKFYNLEKFNIKDIDKYLWQLGKKYFPKTYGKKRGASNE